MNTRDLEPHPAPHRAALLQPAAFARRILVPVDGSPLAEAAIEEAVDLAHALHACVRFVHVVDPRALLFDPSHAHATADMLVKRQMAHGELLLRRAVDCARANGVDCDSVLLHDPPARVSDLLIDAIEKWGANLVAMGTHARTGLDRLLIGSTAHAVLLGSQAPVLMIPAGRRR